MSKSIYYCLIVGQFDYKSIKHKQPNDLIGYLFITLLLIDSFPRPQLNADCLNLDSPPGQHFQNCQTTIRYTISIKSKHTLFHSLRNCQKISFSSYEIFTIIKSQRSSDDGLHD